VKILAYIYFIVTIAWMIQNVLGQPV